MVNRLIGIGLFGACLSLSIVLSRTSPPPTHDNGPAQAAIANPTPEQKTDERPRTTITEYLNLRPLIEKLRPDGYIGSTGFIVTHLRTKDDTCVQIAEIFASLVAPDSWRSTGGADGDFQEVAGILIVTQTPENLRAVHRVLRCLEQAAETDGWKTTVDLGQANTTAGIDVATPARNLNGKPKLETDYFNIRLLVDALRANEPQHPETPQRIREIESEILSAICSAVAPESWMDAGGTCTIWEVGGVLIITQTPENLRACRDFLEKLRHTTSEKTLPQATRPATAPAE